MWLSPDGFNKDVNIVKITVEGYDTFEYQINKEVKDPVITFKKADYFGTDGIKLDFDTNTLFAQDYLSEMKKARTTLKVTVNGTVFSRSMSSFDKLSKGKYKVVENSAYGTVTGLELSLEGDGYKTIKLSYKK